MNVICEICERSYDELLGGCPDCNPESLNEYRYDNFIDEGYCDRFFEDMMTENNEKWLRERENLKNKLKQRKKNSIRVTKSRIKNVDHLYESDWRVIKCNNKIKKLIGMADKCVFEYRFVKRNMSAIKSGITKIIKNKDKFINKCIKIIESIKDKIVRSMWMTIDTSDESILYIGESKYDEISVTHAVRFSSKQHNHPIFLCRNEIYPYEVGLYQSHEITCPLCLLEIYIEYVLSNYGDDGRNEVLLDILNYHNFDKIFQLLPGRVQITPYVKYLLEIGLIKYSNYTSDYNNNRPMLSMTGKGTDLWNYRADCRWKEDH